MDRHASKQERSCGAETIEQAALRPLRVMPSSKLASLQGPILLTAGATVEVRGGTYEGA